MQPAVDVLGHAALDGGQALPHPHGHGAGLVAADDELAKLITDEKTTALEAWQSTTEAAPWDHEAVLEVLHTHPEQNLVVLGAPDGGFYVIPVTRGSVMKN